jgi:hypothetical protein
MAMECARPDVVRTVRMSSSTSAAIHVGWKMSGKFLLLNEVKRYSQGASVTD